MVKKVLLTILALLILAVGGVAYWQRDLIKAYYLSTQYSKEEIKAQMDDSKKVLEATAGIEIREFTEEEKKEIETGSATENEVIAKIVTEGMNKSPDKSTNPKGNAPKETASPVDPVKEATAKYVTQIYALQSEYVGRLDGLMNEAKNTYLGLVKEMKASEAKKKMMSEYLGKISGLERECDGRFNTILAQLESELKSLSAKTDVIKTIRDAYLKEKELKRAYYMTYLS